MFKLYEFPHSHNYDSDLREVLALLYKVLDDYEALVTRLTAAETDIAALKADAIALRAEFEIFKVQANKLIADAIAEMEAEVDAKLKEADQRLIELMNRVLALFDTFMDEVDAKLAANNLALRTEFNLRIGPLENSIIELWEALNEKVATTMLDPLDKVQDTIPNVIKNLYVKAQREHALFNWEWKSLGLTVDEYKKKGLSVYEYDLVGRDAIHDYWWKSHRHPYTGFKTNEENIQSWFLTALLNTINVENYAGLDLTVKGYKELDLTVTDYLELPNPEPEGLTVDQYATLHRTNPGGIARTTK